MTCCGSCCHRDIPRCADVFSRQSPDLLKMTSYPYLPLPPGELSAKLTERACDVPFLSYFKKNSDIKIAIKKTECYNILYITLLFDFEYM